MSDSNDSQPLAWQSGCGASFNAGSVTHCNIDLSKVKYTVTHAPGTVGHRLERMEARFDELLGILSSLSVTPALADEIRHLRIDVRGELEDLKQQPYYNHVV
jgi:hypothetical protein